MSEQFQSRGNREADARSDIQEFEQEVAQSQPIIFRNERSGAEIDPGDVLYYRDAATREVKKVAAPRLNPNEEAEAARALGEALEAGAVKYPGLANHLLQNPHKLWLLGEIQMMLSPERNEVSYDFTADLMEGLTTTTAQREEYEFVTAHEATQQLFWNEVGNKYSQEDRQFLIDALSQLGAQGANRVGAQALAWVDQHAITDEESKAQLFLNIANWAAKEQQYEKGQTGFFGTIDALQEMVETNLVSPLVNAGVGLISGAEEAARRRDLSVGQQVAYQAGIKPPEVAGDFGWWELVSGGADALVEVGADPFAWMAGLGAGAKAVKTIPVAARATRAGRALAAARALLPKPFAGVSRRIGGGRFARVTYALGNKSVDDLLKHTLKNGVAEDAFNLVKQGNLGKFGRLYPAWRNMSDDAIRVIQESVESPEEFLEVLKADALNEVLRGEQQLAELTANAKRSEDAMRAVVAVDHTADDIVQEIIAKPGDFVFHGTRRIDDETADLMLRGEDAFDRGGISLTRDRGEHYANLTRPSGATGIVDPQDGKVLVFRKADLPTQVQKALEQGDVEEYAAFFKTLEDVKPVKPVHIYRADDGLEAGLHSQRYDDLLLDQSISPDLRLQAAKDRLRLNAYNLQNGHVFILSEVPQHSKRIFSWQKALDIKGTGRLATGVRRTAARITPGRIPDNIALTNTRQGIDDLRRLGEHFGLQQNVLDDLMQEFEGLEIGARQDWVWDSFMRRLGHDTGVPAFEQQLIQFYKGAGVRNFSASGVDLLPDGTRIPMLASQITDKMPVPVDVLNQVFNRARSIGTRSKLARALGFNGRGLGATAARRTQLMKRLRRELGETADDLSDDQLYDMAFSLVSPNAGLDGRGIWAGKMMPKAGSWAHSLHQWFTKSMLVFRPIQWMWRVALLEEPIRAHLFNLPSLYSNPLQYMGRMREAHYIWNVQKWAEANLSWGQDVMATLLKGTRQDILNRVADFGLTDEIFAGTIPRSLTDVRREIEGFVESALYGRVRPTKLNPIKRVPWAVKNRARSVATAEKALKKLNLPADFDFHAEAAEIAGRLVSGYLGEAVGSSHRKLYQWQTGLTNDEAYTHGRVWGANLIQFVEDPFGRMALRRRAAILRNQAPDVTGADVVNSSRWQLLAPDLRVKYAGEADDIAVAERYLDDMLSQEIDHLFRPFANELDPDMLADLLDEFATTRQIATALGNDLIEWDLRSANFGAGVRQVGDTTASLRRSTIAIPDNLPAPSFDGRFMAEDDPGFPSRMANWVLQTFGEKATQTLNRRPAWLHAYNRWFENYRGLDVPVEHAQRLAIDHANKMVNHVFFNMNEAPYYVARLNRFLPFFGATYEVLGTWSYKMPVAVGGTWPAGIGEFTRKFDRLIDGLVNMGLLSREVEEDGTTTITLNLVPPSSGAAAHQEAGRWLSGAGFAAVNTLDQAVSTLLGLEEGLGLRSQGYRLAAGHPLNPADYGILSFAQADIGFNPATNILVTSLAGRIPGAGAPRREVAQEGETLADLAERLGVTTDELVRYNREVFIDTEDFGSSGLYNGLLGGDVDPEGLVLPSQAIFNLPGSSLWDAMSDTFMPFGEISSPHEFATNFIPGALRWAMAGLALQNQPTDSFWKDSELQGIFGGILPEVNQAQVASQLNEAFMYLEAHDLVNGKGPFTRIQEKEARLQGLIAFGTEREANALRNEINMDTQAFLDRAQKVAAESLILRGLTGNMLPTTPGHVREEEEIIRQFWDTREYADSIKSGKGVTRLRNFKNMEEVEAYKGQLAAWLNDPTGDRARAVFRANNPQLMAYLTPKTFYTAPVPDINSYEEYQRQIKSGEREPSPLHITMWRARSAAIQADYYNKYIAEFGNNPLQAAATALQNRSKYQELNDERDLSYQALEMWDEMHGSVYDTWRKENYDDVETWAQDQINDKLNKVRDNLGILFELEDNLDIELDLEGVANLNTSIRGAIAEISNAIRDYNSLTEQTTTRNAYEQAINQYFQEVYIPYAERVAELYDMLPEVADSERQSLIYERIKFVKNEYADSLVYLGDDTTTPFPNPLEYSWQGKDTEEQRIKMQQWITRPIEWMDLDQSIRILETTPQMAGYVPQTRADFDIYRQFTTRKITLDEMFEANEITRSQRNEAMKNLETELKRSLIEMGRGREVTMMSLTPYEKLELSGLLPTNLGIFGDHVRYYKQVLEVAEESPGTIKGRRIVAPLYDLVEQAYYADPDMRTTLQELGVNLQDQSALDAFLPWLFFGSTGER